MRYFLKICSKEPALSLMFSKDCGGEEPVKMRVQENRPLFTWSMIASLSGLSFIAIEPGKYMYHSTCVHFLHNSLLIILVSHPSTLQHPVFLCRNTRQPLPHRNQGTEPSVVMCSRTSCLAQVCAKIRHEDRRMEDVMVRLCRHHTQINNPSMLWDSLETGELIQLKALWNKSR